ncbi:integral membrane protein [Sporosarcina globispora]|uniref:Integral membrane protein n=1 Tax=Sporosarcina globispora TaxID=1459 RepID=A0A0M0GJX7_SPOGL|nr:YesL family protein [Sporosarcina globispora]KON90058.1 integral membrane protein [Sporosarcina globispora]
MESNGLIGRFYRFSEIVMKIVLIQGLWVAFTLCGVIILGIMPATIGMFTAVRKWMMGEDNNRTLIKAFWSAFRKEFWRANAMGLVLCLLSFLLYMNFSIIRFTEGYINLFLLIGLFTLSILFLIVLIYIFPVYVHFDLKFFQYFTMSLLLGISSPIYTLLAVFGCFVLYRLFLWIPGLIPFFSIGLFALFIMWVSLKTFKKAEQKQEGETNTYRARRAKKINYETL